MNREISASESPQATACGDADPQVVLQRRFGLSDFRTGQREIIDSVLGGRDTLAIMPTGSGKSLCYQLPAVARDALVIVISPLISRMRDQVAALRALNTERFSTASCPEWIQPAAMSSARRAATWSRISEIRGEMTITSASRATAGNW